MTFALFKVGPDALWRQSCRLRGSERKHFPSIQNRPVLIAKVIFQTTFNELKQEEHVSACSHSPLFVLCSDKTTAKF